ncbi:hypothetical protein MMC27_004715 [Xylographa pallens]|nr:hypothetical protein [Xylographa pallens]
MATNQQLGAQEQDSGSVIAKQLCSSAIGLAVGENRHLYWAHKALLVEIPFFRVRFASTNLGVPESTIEVDMCHPAVFDIFLQFLYQHPLKATDMVENDIFRLLALHEMCEIAWGTIKHANAVMAAMIAWVEQDREGERILWSRSLIKQIYGRGTQDSRPRKFLVWYVVTNAVGVDMDMKWLAKAVQHDSRFAADVTFYSSRLYNKDVSTREIAISGLRDSLYLAENGDSTTG